MMRTAAILLAWLLITSSSWAGEAAQHLAEAVRIKTISYQQGMGLNSHPALQEMQAYLRQTYPLVHSQLQVEYVNDFSIVITWPGSDAALRPVLYIAHHDVVPVEAGTEADWTHPAYAGVIADGIIYGRGTMDDKVGVISLLEAVERLLAQGYQPRRTLVFGFGHDEEIGGDEGAAQIAALFRERGLSFEWMVDEGGMIISDNPMMPNRTAAMIGVAEKQFLTLVLVARGEGGHSSMPPTETTIGRLAAAVKRVEDHPFSPRLVEPMRTSFQRMAPHMDFPFNVVLDNLWATDWLVAQFLAADPRSSGFVRTTTALTMFNAGVKDNVIPQSAEARINFRILPGDSDQHVIERVTRLVNDPSIEITIGRKSPAGVPVAAMAGGGYDIIEAAATAIYPDVVALPFMLPASTDIRHYLDLADNHYRFHGNLISVTQASGPHGTDEQLGVESFERAVDVAVEMLRATGSP